MPSIFDLLSWTRDELTAEQQYQFRTEAVGESSYTLRTTFKVICTNCNKVLHSNTNNPSVYIDQHKCEK